VKYVKIRENTLKVVNKFRYLTPSLVYKACCLAYQWYSFVRVN